jgi:hypothetical protein
MTAERERRRERERERERKSYLSETIAALEVVRVTCEGKS